MNYIAVCTPARDQVHTNYTYCMVNMVAYHTLNTSDAISLKLMQGTIIQNQRADLCLDAMREGCTHILFIDSDMGAALTHGIKAQVSTLILDDRALHQFQTDGV